MCGFSRTDSCGEDCSEHSWFVKPSASDFCEYCYHNVEGGRGGEEQHFGAPLESKKPAKKRSKSPAIKKKKAKR